VGNTVGGRLSRQDNAVHPHTRGEHGFISAASRATIGSSPHTWGTRYDLWKRIGNGRFIPTHVGNTSRMPMSPARSPVHPHTRGEHITRPSTHAARSGSSPHTWGTRYLTIPLNSTGRFIPTHVGNTPPRAGAQRPATVCGSSPHTWGTLGKLNALCQFVRFIPTHVGNTH